MTYAIDTDNLTRRYGRREAIHGLSVQVPTGSVFALVGPNGAGKTTTIKVLLNLIRATTGKARVLGVDSAHLDVPTLRRIGYVSETNTSPTTSRRVDCAITASRFIPLGTTNWWHGCKPR